MAWLVWASSCQIEEHIWITTNPLFGSGECVVPVLSWLCTNRSCHVWVCFLQQEMKEKVCLQRGWMKSQQAEDFHGCDLDKTSLWTPVLDSEVTVAVKWQCQVLCVWNHEGCQKQLGHPLTFLLLHFLTASLDPQFTDVGNCLLKTPQKLGLWIQIAEAEAFALGWHCTDALHAFVFFLFTLLELCLKSLLSFFFLTWSYNCLFVLLCAAYVVGFVLLEILLSGSTLLLSLAGILWTKALKNAGG